MEAEQSAGRIGLETRLGNRFDLSHGAASAAPEAADLVPARCLRCHRLFRRVCHMLPMTLRRDKPHRRETDRDNNQHKPGLHRSSGRTSKYLSWTFIIVCDATRYELAFPDNVVRHHHHARILTQIPETLHAGTSDGSPCRREHRQSPLSPNLKPIGVFCEAHFAHCQSKRFFSSFAEF